MEKVKIRTEYITLGQFLKFAGIIDSGFVAKLFLQDETVYVNGEIERRRGKKLYNGHKVKVDNKEYTIISDVCDKKD